MASAVTASVLAAAVAACSQDPEPEPPPDPLPGHDVTAGRRLVFDEEFDRLSVGAGKRWGWQSGAFPDCTTNRGNFKLDRLSRSALAVADGRLTITATPDTGGHWSTGLLATGDACESGGGGFHVRTGDMIVAHAALPEAAATGAWPAIWTWWQGGREVDVFEWHADAPRTLELVNHVKDTYIYWKSPRVAAGRWLYVAVHLGGRQVTWYVGGKATALPVAHRDTRGVGPDYRAHLVVSLSVDDGKLHQRPEAAGPLRFVVDSVKVYR